MNNVTFSNLSSNKLLKGRLSNPVMYSADGANFQEWALTNLDTRGSAANQAIGRLVTSINNGKLTVAQAKSEFCSLLN